MTGFEPQTSGIGLEVTALPTEPQPLPGIGQPVMLAKLVYLLNYLISLITKPDLLNLAKFFNWPSPVSFPFTFALFKQIKPVHCMFFCHVLSHLKCLACTLVRSLFMQFALIISSSFIFNVPTTQVYLQPRCTYLAVAVFRQILNQLVVCQQYVRFKCVQ